MNWTPDQVVARFERWISKRILRLQDPRVVIGVIAVYEEPLSQADFRGEVDATSEGQVGIEKGAVSRLAGGNHLTKSAVDAVGKTDDVVEAGVEIVCGELPAI